MAGAAISCSHFEAQQHIAQELQQELTKTECPGRWEVTRRTPYQPTSRLQEDTRLASARIGRQLKNSGYDT